MCAGLSSGLGLAVLAGCATTSAVIPEPAEPGATNTLVEVRSLEGRSGRVVGVNPALQFVVIDYVLNVPPEPGQRLVCYRGDEPVAILKAGFIRRATTVSADILSGTPVIGDVVRMELAAGGN